MAESAAALALGVDGTPTMFVNGKPVVGARDIETMAKLVEAQLAQARQVTGGGIAAKDYYPVVMSGAVGVERGDPTTIGELAGMRVALRADDRERAVAAACRRRDAKRAVELAGPLTGPARLRAVGFCAAAGLDI
jgi:hypothetical protein